MDNLSQQIDEIEALVAIYNDDWQIEDIENRSYSIRIPYRDCYAKLYFKLPVEYPSNSPPYYEISAPHLDLAAKNRLGQLLDEVYSSCIGETVLYQWIERVREELQSDAAPAEIEHNDEEIIYPAAAAEAVFLNAILPSETNNVDNCPNIHHGEVIVDRKSSFQGHAAAVFSVADVKQVLKTLLAYRKIQQATHNVHAYRILRDDKKSFLQDCEDDGEAQAGGRLLHLLEIMEAKNVLVVVSRWYGGTHLGPDRFRHINNAARQILQSAELVPKNRDNKK